MNPVRNFFQIVRGLLLLMVLPLAAVAHDRVYAAHLYLTTQPWHEVQRQRRNRRSLLRRLERAAWRQKRINSINLPEYRELQRRKRSRRYNYELVLKRVLFWFAIAYGANRVEFLLKEFSPAAYGIWVWACYACIHVIDSFWKTIALSLGAQ